MNITGLITEYNPFHNGHLYHLSQSKKETDADYLIVLMSGSFVQRGAPAIYDKYGRASMALKAGADLVLEMPCAFSTASAREFASYGIALFTALGAVNCVSFGSECGDAEQLKGMARFLLNEPEEFSLHLKEGMRRGLTWPESRGRAVEAYFSSEEQELLLSPNNILGIEYCRAALEQESSISMHTIKRRGNGYHDELTDSPFPSATAIRGLLEKAPGREDTAALLTDKVPVFTADIIRNQPPVFLNDFSELLNYRILSSLGPARPNLEEIADMTPDLAARLKKTALCPLSFEQRIQSIKSRQFTYTRVSRALLHLLLNMREEDLQRFKEAGYSPYARILGFRKAAAPLLSHLKKSAGISLLAKPADSRQKLSGPGLQMLEQEILASHLYQTIRTEKGCAFKNEYTQPIIIL